MKTIYIALILIGLSFAAGFLSSWQKPTPSYIVVRVDYSQKAQYYRKGEKITLSSAQEAINRLAAEGYVVKFAEPFLDNSGASGIIIMEK